jgi:hypothetical protein
LTAINAGNRRNQRLYGLYALTLLQLLQQQRTPKLLHRFVVFFHVHGQITPGKAKGI